MRKKLLFGLAGILCIYLLLVAINNSGPRSNPIPPIPLTPIAWGPLPAPPSEVAQDKIIPAIRLKPEQAVRILPARILYKRIRDEFSLTGIAMSTFVLTAEFKNNTNHDIESTQGGAVLQDDSGQLMEIVAFDLIRPVKAGASIISPVVFPRISSIETHKLLKDLPIEEMKVEYQPRAIVYSTGDRQEIKYDRAGQ